MTYTSPPGAGAKLRGSVLEALITEPRPITVVKALDESVTSSTTLQDDDELLLPVIASATYSVDLLLIATGVEAGDLSLAWSGPTAATLHWVPYALDTGATATTGSIHAKKYTIADSVGMGLIASNDMGCRVAGTLITSANAGNLTFRWAQRVSSGTATTVKAGSRLTIVRLI